jgi:hypothetical protein
MEGPTELVNNEDPIEFIKRKKTKKRPRKNKRKSRKIIKRKKTKRRSSKNKRRTNKRRLRGGCGYSEDFTGGSSVLGPIVGGKRGGSVLVPAIGGKRGGSVLVDPILGV